MEQRVSIITLGVSNLERAKGFYDALGWQAASDFSTEGIVAYDLIAMTLCLYPTNKLAEDIGAGAEGKAVSGEREAGKISTSVTLAYNVGSRAEVDSAMSVAIAAGATEVKPAQEVFWGGYSGYFADPDGNLWEVAHNPFARLGPNREFQWNGCE